LQLYDSWLGKKEKKVLPITSWDQVQPICHMQSWPETSDETLLDMG
jgi:hypothetical protein